MIASIKKTLSDLNYRSEDKGCDDRAGAAPRSDSPPPYSHLAHGAITNERPTLLRFHLREAWKLSVYEEWLRSIQLSAQGGKKNKTIVRFIIISTLVSKLSFNIFYINDCFFFFLGSDSTFIWRGPDSIKETTGSEQREAFWQITAAQEIDSDCESFTIWVLPKRDNAGRPWLLYAKLEPNQDFPILLLEPMQQSVTTTLEPTTGTLRNGHPYAKGSRLVELQYQLRETIQSEAALALWASKFLQNDASRTVTKLLHHIRDSQGRRLLRLLRKSGTPTMSLGRISRAENNLLVKRVPPGIGDEPQAKR